MNLNALNAPILHAPNLGTAGIPDDSHDFIVSRTVARILAKGLGIQGIYTDGWSSSSRNDIRRWRVTFIDVVTDPTLDAIDQDAIGSVTVHERDVCVDLGRNTATPTLGVRTVHQLGHMAPEGGSSKPLCALLGWDTE